MATVIGPDITTDGLVLHLDAANPISYSGSGTAWNDLSSNGNAAMVNTPVFNSTSPKNFSFDATNEYFSLSGNSEMAMNGDVTLISWFKQNTTGSPHQTTICTAVNYRAGLKLMSHYHGPVSAWLGNSDGSDSYLLGSSLNIEGDGLWHQAATTRSSSTGFLTIYVDGVLKNSATSYTGLTHLAGIPAVGVDYHSSGYYYDGNIAMCTAYNRVLTTLEIQQNYNQFKSRFI
jgi:hypothetical protein|tara:strand:+ start:74 stop:766 length:693 start_codon:yes stop_codon:yes gene_type:complete